MVKGPCAPAFHLLEVVAASNVPHEEQAFERPDVSTRRDHVYSHGNARVIVVLNWARTDFGSSSLL